MSTSVETKKKAKVSIKKEYIIAIVLIIAVIICLVFLFSKKSEDSNKDNEPKTEEKGKVFTEKDIEDAYGMSSSDAIEIVKKLYNSDNFKFDASVSGDAKYIVTVTNTITNYVYKFEVDPINESFYEIK